MKSKKLKRRVKVTYPNGIKATFKDLTQACMVLKIGSKMAWNPRYLSAYYNLEDGFTYDNHQIKRG